MLTTTTTTKDSTSLIVSSRTYLHSILANHTTHLCGGL